VFAVSPLWALKALHLLIPDETIDNREWLNRAHRLMSTDGSNKSHPRHRRQSARLRFT